MIDMIERYDEGNINEVFHLKNEYMDIVVRKSKFSNEFESYVLKKLQPYNLNIPEYIDSYSIGDEYVMLYKHIKGRTPKMLNACECNQIVQFLKRLHCVEISEKEKAMVQPKEDLHQMQEYIRKIKKKLNREEYRFICVEYETLNKKYETFENLKQCFIHSDIKKENILVNEDTVYVIDFGNCYIGSRLVDIVRVIMWLFLYDQSCLDDEEIKKFCQQYFDQAELDQIEYEMVSYVLRYCLLYNYVKDKYLFCMGVLSERYVQQTSSKWLEIMKNKTIINKVVEMIQNAGCSRRV